MSGLPRAAHRLAAALPRPVLELGLAPVRRFGDRELRALAPMPPAARRLYLGPWNTAGQGWEWARAAQRHLTDVAAQNLWASRPSSPAFAFRADHVLTARAQRGHVREIHGERVLREATHVVHESGRAVLADFHAASMLADQGVLRAAGVDAAVLYHGSEVRDLRDHAERHAHSPFRLPEREWDDYLRALQGVVETNRADLARWLDAGGGQVYVSTPDLLDHVPGATWLPLVVDVDRFEGAAARMGVRSLGRERPVVLHPPSNPRLKGTVAVEEALTGLERDGLVEYRRLSGVPHARMAEVVADADVVIDQVVLGNPGVLVAESLAAGRLVVAHLAEEVRHRFDGELPVVEADPDTLRDVLERVLGDRAAHQDIADRGPAWAREHHDGRRAARVLGTWLGPDDGRPGSRTESGGGGAA